MRKTTALALLAALTLGSTAALAGDGKGSHDGHHGPKFEEIDTNKDGAITREEMEAHHRKKLDAMFEKADGDKDGKLSQEELRKGREEWRAKMKERFDKMKERREAKEDKKAE
jgi:Ca2+-binding EF-hand superfamily protein